MTRRDESPEACAIRYLSQHPDWSSEAKALVHDNGEVTFAAFELAHWIRAERRRCARVAGLPVVLKHMDGSWARGYNAGRCAAVAAIRALGKRGKPTPTPQDETTAQVRWKHIRCRSEFGTLSPVRQAARQAGAEDMRERAAVAALWAGSAETAARNIRALPLEVPDAK